MKQIKDESAPILIQWLDVLVRNFEEWTGEPQREALAELAFLVSELENAEDANYWRGRYDELKKSNDGDIVRRISTRYKDDFPENALHRIVNALDIRFPDADEDAPESDVRIEVDATGAHAVDYTGHEGYGDCDTCRYNVNSPDDDGVCSPCIAEYTETDKSPNWRPKPQPTVSDNKHRK